MENPSLEPYDDEISQDISKEDYVVVHIMWLLDCIRKRSTCTKKERLCWGVIKKQGEFVYPLPYDFTLSIKWTHINYGTTETYNEKHDVFNPYSKFVDIYDDGKTNTKTIRIFLETISGDMNKNEFVNAFLNRLYYYFGRLFFKERL